MANESWGFYGRRDELDQLSGIFNRGRWFFVKISGRRRIGKTTLVQAALRASKRDRVLYIQIPDSDPIGVVSTARDFLDAFQVPGPRPHNLRTLAASLASLIRQGYVVALDEFQYFHRRILYEFTSYLQAEVDRLSGEASSIRGGLILLGSIHTEMSALLDDRSAPLFNRLTDSLDLDHLDLASVLEILRKHADGSPERLLFLWNLFEGVPKFYRDCHEQDALAADRRTVLKRMFFSSSATLRNEAENWFLREFRGRYDLVLKFVARNPGCTNGDLDAHTQAEDPDSRRQLAGYIRVLGERYGMIERLQPVFAKPKARSGRFYIRDNFLRSWLAALAVPAASINFRPLEQILQEADTRLQSAEGHGFEKLVARLYAERSRKGVGDFNLTSQVQGYWDRKGIEIDMVALDETSRRIRLATCKRSVHRLIPDLATFDGHIARFLEAMPRFKGWTVEKAAIAPQHGKESREWLAAGGWIPQDLTDLIQGL
jgi:hypothetical protein